MGYWGWRPLVYGVFISAWVAGCTIVASTNSPAHTPTAYPLITLTSGRLFDPTAPPIIGSSPITLTPSSSTPVVSSLEVDPPACYPLPTGALLCLGRVHNRLRQPASAAIIEVVLSPGEAGSQTPTRSAADDRVRTAALEQSLIPAGGYAPYRVEFSAEEADGRHQVYARLLAGSVLPPDVRSLETTLLRLERPGSGERADVLLRVVNPFDATIQMTRVVVTVYEGQVLGYRAERLTAESGVMLAAGESHEISLTVFLHQRVTDNAAQADAEAAVSVYAEGLITPAS
ncbi:MAG: hypothetical protein IPK19_39245 [Chloroflexi bacterium]|nr:hypothetical protein [Chloroflexota bacterium]